MLEPVMTTGVSSPSSSWATAGRVANGRTKLMRATVFTTVLILLVFVLYARFITIILLLDWYFIVYFFGVILLIYYRVFGMIRFSTH
jgi:cell division protein FtsW (lipid II flippase)